MGDHDLLNKGPFHFEGLLRVPLLWSWPGHFPGGRVLERPTSLLDFAPTVLELAGQSIPADLTDRPHPPAPWPGRSLAPWLRGGPEPDRSGVIVENDEDYLGLRLRTLITERYKLTWYAGRPYGELFDLEADPHEHHNRWDEPAAAGLRDAMTRRLLDELIQSDPGLPRALAHA
jgi:arylsulfatase